jgi:transcriptional regulator with XRE-family HTH domain
MLTKDNQPTIQSKLGFRIKALRKEKGYYQEKFASLCGLHRTYIGCLERGERNITIANIQKISNSLNISLSNLFKDL